MILLKQFNSWRMTTTGLLVGKSKKKRSRIIPCFTAMWCVRQEIRERALLCDSQSRRRRSTRTNRPLTHFHRTTLVHSITTFNKILMMAVSCDGVVIIYLKISHRFMQFEYAAVDGSQEAPINVLNIL